MSATAETFVLANVGQVRRFVMWLGRLSFDKPWKVTIQQVSRGSTVEQEAVLRGKERQIAEFTGHDPDEIHEQMLADHYGTEQVGKLIRPARRTRTGPNSLNAAEMSDHIRWVEAFAARELGMSLA